MVPNLFWNCKKYAGYTYVMLKVNVVFDFDNVAFVKLAIGWVGGWFWWNIRNDFEEPFNYTLKLTDLTKLIE